MKHIALRDWLAKGVFALFLFICAAANGAEASITMAWQPSATNADGTPCTDLAGYKIYYDTDQSGAPYNGTGLAQGASPIIVPVSPVSSLADPSNPQFVVSGLTAGTTYYVVVTSYDTSSNESGYSNEITAVEYPPVANSPPTAAIGASPTEGIAPLSVSFSGTGTDTDGTVTDYTWNFGDGSNSSSQNTTHTYSSAGNYTATLTVTDDGGATGLNSVQIAVISPPPSVNHAPTANAGSDKSVTQSQLSQGSVQVTLSGSSSSDPDGDALSFSWTQTQGSFVNLMGGTTATPFFSVTTAASGQTLGFQLVVSDGKLQSNPDTVLVVVEAALPPPNVPPTAVIGASPTEGIAPLSVSFSGTGTDTDGTVTNYTWNFGDGSSANVQNPSHIYISAGTYTATLTVTDNGGATGSATKQIVVSAPNKAPTASITASPTSGTVPLTVSFTATASDSDGSIVSYSWNFGDGSISSSTNPSHTYSAAGTYTATLTVTDNGGAQTSATKTISVASLSTTQDSDNDGLPDVLEIQYGLNPNSVDSDGDGISDFIEWGPGSAPLDTDGDGIIDALDTDSDNDGKADNIEGTGDVDGDGAPNYIDKDDIDGPLGDQDGDGINNSTEVTYMMNPNLADSDVDGIDDGTEFGSLPWPLDSDGDGIIDALDTDSDNDGKSDIIEGTGDIDGDGAPNYMDKDDNDGPLGDQDHDVLTNIQETGIGLNPNLSDSDQYGIPDAEEIGNVNSPEDTDGDGMIDALDTDTDNDGISDIEELREDMDGNGIPDSKDDSIASFVGKIGKMALKVIRNGCRITDAVLIPDAFFTEKWKPLVPLRYGGLQFKVKDIHVGETVTVQVIIARNFNKNAQYWKYDPNTGYTQIDTKVSGNVMSFNLADGGMGDADHTANGMIEDPGFIAEPEEAISTPIDSLVSSPATSSGGGGGGGGCRVSQNQGSIPDGFLFFIPLLVLLVLKRTRKV